MKSCCTFTCVAMLIFLLGSFPVAAADSWQRGDQACSVSDWIIPLQEPLVRFTSTFEEPIKRYTASIIAITDKINSPDKGADADWLKELLLSERELFFVLHEASVGLVQAAAHVIEDCGLSDEVSAFLSTPVDTENPLAKIVRPFLSLNFEHSSPEMRELVDPCWIVPAMEASITFVHRFLSSADTFLQLESLQGQELLTAPPDALVRLYGIALEFSEVSRVIIEDCDLTESDTGGTGVGSTERRQESAAEVRPTATPVPQDPTSCQWQDAYRGVLDAFLIQVNLVNADSPDAPGKLQDYALNLANSLDDSRQNCGLP